MLCKIGVATFSQRRRGTSEMTGELVLSFFMERVEVETKELKRLSQCVFPGRQPKCSFIHVVITGDST